MNEINQKIRSINNTLSRLLHTLFITSMLLYQDSHDPSQYMKYFALGAVIFCINIPKAIKNKDSLKISSCTFVYLLFIVYASISLLCGVSTQLPAYKMFMFGAAMFVAYAIECKQYENRLNLLKDFWIGGVVICFYILANYTMGLNGRIKVLGMNVINAGIAAAFAALFGLYLWQTTKKKLYLLQIPLGLCIVVLSGSKSALIAFLILFLIYYLVTANHLLSRFSILLVSALLIICAYFIIMNNESLYSLMGYRIYGFARTISGESGGQDEDRITMIKLGLDVFSKYPIFGAGFDCFRVVNGWTATWSHCNYTEVLSCFGLVGFVLYYSRYLLIYKNLKCKDRIPQKDKALCFSILVCTLMMDLSIVNYYTTMNQITFALLCAKCRYDEKMDSYCDI